MNIRIKNPTGEYTRYDAVLRTMVALLRQGGPAQGERGCQYRTPEGRACAAGMWMKDSEYHKSWEDTVVTHLSNVKGTEKQKQVAEDICRRGAGMLPSLQKVHDTAAYTFEGGPSTYAWWEESLLSGYASMLEWEPMPSVDTIKAHAADPEFIP